MGRGNLEVDSSAAARRQDLRRPRRPRPRLLLVLPMIDLEPDSSSWLQGVAARPRIRALLPFGAFPDLRAFALSRSPGVTCHSRTLLRSTSTHALLTNVSS